MTEPRDFSQLSAPEKVEAVLAEVGLQAPPTKEFVLKLAGVNETQLSEPELSLVNQVLSANVYSEIHGQFRYGTPVMLRGEALDRLNVTQQSVAKAIVLNALDLESEAELDDLFGDQ